MSAEHPTHDRPRQEPSDLQPRVVLWGAAAIVGTVLLTALIAHLLTRAESPVTTVPQNLQPARATRLSSDPADEIAAFDRGKRTRLESYGWVDQQQGVAHVPIERAMQMLAEQNSARGSAQNPTRNPAPDSTQNSGQGAPPPAAPAAYIDVRQVGWDQRLGASLPLDLRFRDEAARPVKLGDYFGSKPVVLVLSYFSCPELCPQVLHAVQESLQRTQLAAGRDYEWVAVSIDPRDTPTQAQQQKLKLLGTSSAQAGPSYASLAPTTPIATALASPIHFLTAANGSGAVLARDVGFRYLYDAQHVQFAHATGFLVANPRGEISRYFFGIRYPAAEVRTAILDAGRGRISALAEQLLLLCYHFDPTQGRYSMAVINALRVLGIAVLAFGALALWRLTHRTGGRQRP